MFQLSKWWTAFVYRYSSTSPEKETSYFLFSADYRVKEDMQQCWTLFSNLFRISVRIRSTRTLLIFLQLLIVLFATSSNVQTVYLSDEESNMVAIKFWEGLKVLINFCIFRFFCTGWWFLYICMYSFNFTLQALFFPSKFLKSSVQIPNENVSILAVNNAGNSKRLYIQFSCM